MLNKAEDGKPQASRPEICGVNSDATTFPSPARPGTTGNPSAPPQVCNTLKFSDFRMLIERIIKQQFPIISNFPNIYFLYRKFIKEDWLFSKINKMLL
jgi:hypothetical protein